MKHLDVLWRNLVDSGYAPPAPSEKSGATMATGRIDTKGGWIGGLARSWGVALGGGSENPSGAGGVRVSTFGAPKTTPQTNAGSSSSSSWWPFRSKDESSNGEEKLPPSSAPRGIYLHGGVGTGKTYTMFDISL